MTEKTIYPFSDTHCHIHDTSFFSREDGQAAYERALEAGVGRILCVGTDTKSSHEAVQFASSNPGCRAAVGIHPHDAKTELADFDNFYTWAKGLKGTDALAGVGEIGLDYYYNNSPRDQQIELLNRQIELALELEVPVSFHVRDGFDDFWPIFDAFHGITGVLHSFTDSLENMEKGLERGLFIGINGISTFARDRDEVTRAVPLERIVLETDAPFLTPKPVRGNINEPAFIPHVAEFLVDFKSTTMQQVSDVTEQNATTLFF